MSGVADLIMAPVVLPLLAGAGMLLLSGERHRNITATVNVAATFALACVAIALLRTSDASQTSISRVYASAIGRLPLELCSFWIASPPLCCSSRVSWPVPRWCSRSPAGIAQAPISIRSSSSC